jgi:peptidoglycan hydrolase CwlO-like protein
MRKTVVVALALIGVLLVAATVVFYSKYRRSVTDYTQLTAQQEEMRQRYGQAINEIVSIQDSLSAIVMGTDAAASLPARRQPEVDSPGTLHDQVLARIDLLKGAIERTKERIEELDARLKKSGVKIAGLERMISGLKKSVAEKEERIALLGTQVDTLQTRVAGLSAQVEDKQQELAVKQIQLDDKQRELATVFYAMGSKKELIDAGVVEAKGGVLGLGKTLEPTGRFDRATFTPMDTDEQTIIRIPSVKARVLSAQPASSYQLEPVGKDMMELRIQNPEEFRKIKHVVILTS